MTTSSLPLAATRAETSVAHPKSPREDELLDHEYDGIREYDNPMPGWWVKTFWASVLFAFAYVVYYYVSPHGMSVAAAYEEDMRVAREERAKQSLAEAPSEAVLGKLMADKELMQDAKVTFTQRCAQCHEAEGQGLIGPNLTDKHWIHGKGQLMDVYATVSHGVPAKGMPAWELQLQPIELRKLAAFIGTLRGKNLPGKGPEGSEVENW
jgi:cytochrome c oxidase cbb3-type subunit III